MSAQTGEFLVSPPVVHLWGNFARAQLVVRQRDGSGRLHDGSADLTRQVHYVSSDLGVVTVSDDGKLLAAGNGQAMIRVSLNETTHEVPVVVRDVLGEPQIGFLEQVMPIVSKAGCNMGACHASQHGKGGMKLSVFGFEPGNDWNAMVRDREQRRVNFIEPERSLLLEKPTMHVPHGGRLRIHPDSIDYQILKAWLAAGAPKPNPKPPELVKLSVVPWRRVGEVDMQQQLRVEAHYSDGTSRDVTCWAKYDSMDTGAVTVTDDGLVTVTGPGQTPVMVRFDEHADVSLMVIPYGPPAELAGWEPQNFVDHLAAAKFRELGIEPSPLCDDATFLRRAMLDAIGTLPAAEEAAAFLQSTEPDKRARLVDRLLGLTGDPDEDVYNDQYAAWWALKWSDLIRNSSKSIGEQGMWALHNWVREAFRVNKPFDQFVTELITAKGSIYSNGPANYFRINNGAPELTESTAQIFLGVRVECAKCHHHPFENIGQDDYYSMAAFFARVGTKASEEFGLFGSEQVVIVRDSGEVSNPRTGKRMEPTPLGGQPMDNPLDRRIPLAEWLTAPDNPFFARSVVNRYVSYLLGRGLVEPVDDMRFTNPPSNPELMDALAKELVEHHYDLKHLIRTIMTSRLYQLDSQPTPANAADRRFFSHYLVKRLPAEPLLDALDRATGTQTKFKNQPPGTRAIELPDAEYPNYFLNVFAKPRRASVCQCERSPDENLAQALHTLNGDILAGKIADGNGRLAKLLKEKAAHEEIVESLYLATLSRYPNEAEIETSRTFLAESPSPQECYQDLLWALLNSKHFLFVH